MITSVYSHSVLKSTILITFSNRGRKMEQKIVLFSDMASEFGDDQIDMIVNGLKNTSTSLIFV